LEVEMLDRSERDALSEIERRIAAADPELAALLRGRRRLGWWPDGRTRLRVMVTPLVLLTVALLVLGLPGGALAVAALAAGLWWLPLVVSTP
jgi:hypothetical protein